MDVRTSDAREANNGNEITTGEKNKYNGGPGLRGMDDSDEERGNDTTSEEGRVGGKGYKQGGGGDAMAGQAEYA